MPSRVNLTSADLDEIRQSALGAADPLGVAADLADAADTGRLADPDDAGYALALAAEIAESRGKLEAALRYVERAFDTYAKRDDSRGGAVRALRSRILFRTGRDDEALADLEPLRPLLTRYPDAASYISAALAAGGRDRIAEQWLTEAVRDGLAGRAEPTGVDDAGVLFFLLQQRHRVRHVLGLPHDSHDNLADRLETELAGAATGAATGDLVFWSQSEFATLLDKWPGLSEAYGEDWDEHRARLERDLVRRGGGTLLSGTVAGLSGFGDPAVPATRAGYASQLATGPARITWPPERNAACWCGSGNKYKKCCLPRSRSAGAAALR
ncbi:SEC-C domain-containing protein [Actinoplanes sp. NPDC051861]|uniref:SEC-C domain-containing protein n=1 Tax=Actinoplanes sp. NPDC051861 TaxID=3155170 RepID=UPI00342B110F